MPKGVKKTAEEIVQSIINQEKEQIRKIQQKNRERIKKYNQALAKEKQVKRSEFGAEVEKLCRQNPAFLDGKKVLALCEKYFPIQAETNSATGEQAAAHKESAAKEPTGTK